MIAKLYFNNGETVELIKEVSESLRKIIENPTAQSLQQVTVSGSGITYCMWNVYKIEWIK